MTTDTTAFQSEIKDACRQVALSQKSRAEIVEAAVNEFIPRKDEFSTGEAAKRALNSSNVSRLLDESDISGIKFDYADDEGFQILFDRDFGDEFNPDVVLNGQMCVLGRLASEVAERSLDGQRVVILNAEQVVVTGDKTTVIDNYREKMNSRSETGPKFPKRPDRVVKRSIRGMLPYKTPRGRNALERIRVHIGTPTKYSGEAAAPRNKRVSLNPRRNKDFVEIGDICASLGAKVRW